MLGVDYPHEVRYSFGRQSCIPLFTASIENQ